MARDQERRNGKTSFGSRRSAIQGSVAIESGGVANQPSVLMLDAVDALGVVTTNYLWVNRNGKLRISTVFPVLELSDGVAVGDQTGT